MAARIKALLGAMLSRPGKAPDDKRRLHRAAKAWHPALLFAAGLAAFLPGCSAKSTRQWVEQLRSRDAAERLHAVKVLGETSGDADVIVPALVEALKDQDAFVRRDAAAALGKLGARARPAVPALLAATRDGNAGVRKEAARALGRIEPGAPGPGP
jgi:hypothetical protein